jgi:hypothetical protein
MILIFLKFLLEWKYFYILWIICKNFISFQTKTIQTQIDSLHIALSFKHNMWIMCTSNYVTSSGLISGENGTCQDYTKT